MGSPNVGIYILATDACIIIPTNTSKGKLEKIREVLKGETISTNIGGAMLAGVLIAANSNGLLLPHYVYESEVEAIKSVTNINIERLVCKRTALGNLILANDHGALVSAELMQERNAKRKISDVLGVEIVKGTIAGLPYVGSLAIATNKAVLAHPMLMEEERRLLGDVLKVPVDVGTVNFGVPFVSSGLVANKNGIIIGNLTTGPEIMIISNLFGQ